jgi:hypothetical protein
MAANRILIGLLSLLPMIGSAYADSGPTDKSNAVLEYAQKQVVFRAAELGERISACDRQRESAAIPDIQYERLTGMGLTRQQAIAAISHLSARNYALCEGRAREALAFAFGTLSSLADQHGLEIEQIDGIENQLIYPSSREIELKIEFSKLSDEVKSLLFSTVGDRPFKLLPTLRENKLIADKRQ